MNDWLTLLLVLMFLPILRRDARISQATTYDGQARDALNEWIKQHSDCSHRSPRGQQLLRERLTAWRIYLKVCPFQNDNGVMERYLQDILNDLSDQAFPYPMP